MQGQQNQTVLIRWLAGILVQYRIQGQATVCLRSELLLDTSAKYVAFVQDGLALAS